MREHVESMLSKPMYVKCKYCPGEMYNEVCTIRSHLLASSSVDEAEKTNIKTIKADSKQKQSSRSKKQTASTID